MRMGNYMRVDPLPRAVMATTDSGVGIRHVTVVPTNFEPDLDPEEDAEETGSAESN